MVSLDGVRAKLDRADAHIRDLKSELSVLIEIAHRNLAREVDGEFSKLVYVAGHVPHLGPNLSAMVGDALFDMRSAWDHLAWQLVVLDGGTPGESTQFPVYSSRMNKKGTTRIPTIQPRIRRQDILDAIDAVQPYNRHESWLSHLWVVHQLNNWDKHRVLLAMVAGINIDNHPPWWGLPEGVPSPGWWFNVGHPLKSGDPVARFDFRGVLAPADFDPHITLAVTLDEGPPENWMRSTDVVSLLTGLRHWITTEINWRFIPLFGDQPPIAYPSSPA